MDKSKALVVVQIQYEKTKTYDFISSLNQLRNFFINTTEWLKQETQVLTTSPHGIAVMKGDIISVVTNIGSPVSFLKRVIQIVTNATYIL
ncbi:hypothetical protein H0H81_003474 [Sphagnurus paluster]|uniref:Uncharacterized protein n=1 Tax=Sphagnurus paluster TaxID=117069 RepID=A0A9P7K6A8_9AGAR|nr:hypothetical protein H0H81_003474 [Sphagnurus paluster]